MTTELIPLVHRDLTANAAFQLYRYAVALVDAARVGHYVGGYELPGHLDEGDVVRALAEIAASGADRVETRTVAGQLFVNSLLGLDVSEVVDARADFERSVCCESCLRGELLDDEETDTATQG